MFKKFMNWLLDLDDDHVWRYEDDHVWRFKAVRPEPHPSEAAQDNHTWRFKSDKAIIESYNQYK